VIPVEELIRGAPQPGSGTELHGGDGHVQSVDQIGVEELPDGVRAASPPHVLAVGCLERELEHVLGRAADEVERGVGERERRTLVMGHDEDRGVDRWLATPPPPPVVVVVTGPLPTTELIASTPADAHTMWRMR
jgi:hypothetical protein